MYESKKRFDQRTTASKLAIVLAIMALLTILLFFSGCSASDSSPTNDASQSSVETSQSSNQTQQEWNFKWISNGNGGEGKIYPITVTENELLFRFPPASPSNGSTTEIQVWRTTLDTPWFDGQYVERNIDSRDHVRRAELEKIGDGCYIGENVFRPGRTNVWMKIWQPGIECPN